MKRVVRLDLAADGRPSCDDCRCIAVRKWKLPEGSCAETRSAECARDRERAEITGDLSDHATEAILVLRACERQWRVGFAGAIGLDYPAVFQIADRVLGIAITEEVFERLKVAEDEWLSVMAEKREAEEAEMKSKASPAGRKTRPTAR